jgi:phosphocarrier protein HPr
MSRADDETTNGYTNADVVVRNIKGLHARASAKFVKCAETFNAEVSVTRDGQTVGATSIMGLMMLAAGPGSTLAISAQGPDAEAALAALLALVNDGFGEECV